MLYKGLKRAIASFIFVYSILLLTDLPAVQMQYISYKSADITKQFVFLQTDVVVQVIVPLEDGPVFGTAFAISPNIYATASHVVLNKAGTQLILLNTKTGKSIRGVSLAVDVPNDVALIWTGKGDPIVSEKFMHHAFELEPLKQGEMLYSIGYAFGEIFYADQGLFAGVFMNPHQNRKMYTTKAQLFPGMSGGPTYTSEGLLAGVNIIGLSKNPLDPRQYEYQGGISPINHIFNLACNIKQICR